MYCSIGRERHQQELLPPPRTVTTLQVLLDALDASKDQRRSEKKKEKQET